MHVYIAGYSNFIEPLFTPGVPLFVSFDTRQKPTSFLEKNKKITMTENSALLLPEISDYSIFSCGTDPSKITRFLSLKMGDFHATSEKPKKEKKNTQT